MFFWKPQAQKCYTTEHTSKQLCRSLWESHFWRSTRKEIICAVRNTNPTQTLVEQRKPSKHVIRMGVPNTNPVSKVIQIPNIGGEIMLCFIRNRGLGEIQKVRPITNINNPLLKNSVKKQRHPNKLSEYWADYTKI